MQKLKSKFAKIILLLAVIFSDLMTPVSVLANEITKAEANKGDVGINNEASNTGSVTVSSGSLANEGDVLVTKTVSKTDTLGRYKVEFNIKGKDVVSSTEVSKPVYAVVVFDKSGSMKSTKTCIKWEKRNCVEYESDEKWESAVQGAKDFANTLLSKVSSANIALVTFSGDSGRRDTAYDDANVVRGFANANLDNVNFGFANGGTNLHAGLYEANKLLSSSSIPSDAYKYVVIISDGEPTFYYDNSGYTNGEGDSTNTATYNATISMANTVKAKAEVFSIGYMLPSGNVYGNKTAEDILREVATADSVGSKVQHYVNADPEAVANAFNSIASEISRTKAGTNAVLTDNLGSQFTLSTDSDARSYVSEVIPEITEQGTTISFYVDIDQDSATGWHDTNAGFKLEYIDHKGEKRTLDCDVNPQVYWVQNKYNYTVNYYKDSFDSNNLISSDVREAINGTVINESNVDRDKYLPEGYEFNNINPSSITITNDGNNKEINILYTIKKLNYVVNYYYDDILDSSLTINKSDIPYGTQVDASAYYLNDSDIRDGYTLDTVKSDSGTYIIRDNNLVINIYYKKNNYEYSVNYFFNNEKGFTTNDSAIYGDKITAQSKWLSSEELSNQNRSDYFLDPSKSEENNKEITIGTDKDENVLDIYYINTNFDNTNETISKVANNTIVTSSDDKISYKVTYNTSINNVRNGDRVVVTITDKLPGSIVESESILSGGVYNSEDNTITWTYTYEIEEYNATYNISKEINYTVKYENYLSFNGSTLVNTASGYTTVSHEGLDDKTTEGREDSASTEVEVKGTVNVLFKDTDGREIATKVELGEKLAGTEYTTEAKNITGYTLDETKLPSNASGKYIEGNIDVVYYYTKNDGDITENEITKIGPDTVSSVDDTFDYTLTYKGKVENYVGKATLVLTDKLPYDAVIESKDNRCIVENSTVTCTAIYEVNGTKEINDEFNISVKYTNIDSDKVVNTVNSKLTLENNSAETEDEKETEVYKGTVVATYKDTDGNTLHEDVVTTDLAGKPYKTEEKSFYGYTLKEILGADEEGTYKANATLEVNYIYTKNTGDVTENIVNKTQENIITNIDSEYHYVLRYSGKVEDYVGNVTLELTDTLPYNATIISMDEQKCKLDGKTIVCTDVFTIDETNKVINATFDIILKYTSVGAEVKNIVNSKLIYGDNSVTDTDEIIDEVPSGKVTATYITDENVKLHEDVVTTDLVGKEYSTEPKEFFGYTLKEVIGSEKGTYTKEDIKVDYIYTKNAGDIEEPSTEKIGPDYVETVDGTFNYVITASGTIKNYIGKVTLKVVDTLPYKIDESKSTLVGNCIYDGDKTIVCSKEYIIDESDYAINEDGEKEFNINETFDLSLVYIGITDKTVTNSVETEIILDKIKEETEDHTDTEVKEGTVIATYKSEDGITLHEDVKTTSLAGELYKTEEKTFYGYTLREAPSNQEGKYIADEIITVNYVYSKNIGTSSEELEKIGNSLVESVNGKFDYTLNYHTTINDYVGEVKLIITDILPYEIDLEKSVFSKNCTYVDGNIVCTYDGIMIDENNREVNISEEFSLYYIGVNDKVVTNKAEAVLTYGETIKKTDDEFNTEVKEGKVIVNYVALVDGEYVKLTDSIELTGLVGNKYETSKKDFDKYSFAYVIGESEGEYAEEITEVTYVYSLIPLPPQTGVLGMNLSMFAQYALALVAALILRKTYKLLKD